MRLTRGTGTPETGGCWMAVADFYTRGALDWTDQPECVDPIIRPLCIRLNDWCADGEREELIGPHLWAPIGTYSDELRPVRLERVVRFTLDCAADALDAAGVTHELRQDFGRDYKRARAASYANYAGYVAARAAEADDTAAAAHAAAYAAYDADAAGGKRYLLALILDLCAMSEPRELPEGAVSRAEALRVVCGVEGAGHAE